MDTFKTQWYISYKKKPTSPFKTQYTKTEGTEKEKKKEAGREGYKIIGQYVWWTYQEKFSYSCYILLCEMIVCHSQVDNGRN